MPAGGGVTALRTDRVQISGLHCAACVRRAEGALEGAEGVRAARVNLAAGSAEITHAGPLAPALEALRGAGFDVASATLVLEVAGAHCASCTARIEAAAQAAPAVLGARFNLATGRLFVEVPTGAAE